jgi:D-serine deaminase-like pyridoxal phosphate-dependent protein
VITRSFDPAAKGLPSIDDHASGWNLFGDHTTLPAVVILGDVLRRNSEVVAEYCRRRSGVLLAPHGKTTMSPELFELQTRAGTCAIRAAGVHQARVMVDAGVPVC